MKPITRKQVQLRLNRSHETNDLKESGSVTKSLFCLDYNTIETFERRWLGQD